MVVEMRHTPQHSGRPRTLPRDTFAIEAQTIHWAVVYTALIGFSLVALSFAVNFQMQLEIGNSHSQSVSKTSLRAMPVEFRRSPSLAEREVAR